MSRYSKLKMNIFCPQIIRQWQIIGYDGEEDISSKDIKLDRFVDNQIGTEINKRCLAFNKPKPAGQTNR